MHCDWARELICIVIGLGKSEISSAICNVHRGIMSEQEFSEQE